MSEDARNTAKGCPEAARGGSYREGTGCGVTARVVAIIKVAVRLTVIVLQQL
jgi:hypothetical protein